MDRFFPSLSCCVWYIHLSIRFYFLLLLFFLLHLTQLVCVHCSVFTWFLLWYAIAIRSCLALSGYILQIHHSRKPIFCQSNCWCLCVSANKIQCRFTCGNKLQTKDTQMMSYKLTTDWTTEPAYEPKRKKKTEPELNNQTITPNNQSIEAERYFNRNVSTKFVDKRERAMNKKFQSKW